MPEAKLQAALDAWKKKHRLGDDDPLVALAELLRLHQEIPAAPDPGTAAGGSAGRIHRWAAVLAVLMAAAGGYVLGRAWP